ncbi:High mobility group box 1 [Gonapodya sp. JEL0774]|nr:High mobility group box 1 [Gonapodya sp. JEL0774]
MPAPVLSWSAQMPHNGMAFGNPLISTNTPLHSGQISHSSSTPSNLNDLSDFRQNSACAFILFYGESRAGFSSSNPEASEEEVKRGILENWKSAPEHLRTDYYNRAVTLLHDITQLQDEVLRGQAARLTPAPHEVLRPQPTEYPSFLQTLRSPQPLNAPLAVQSDFPFLQTIPPPQSFNTSRSFANLIESSNQHQQLRSYSALPAPPDGMRYLHDPLQTSRPPNSSLSQVESEAQQLQQNYHASTRIQQASEAQQPWAGSSTGLDSLAQAGGQIYSNMRNRQDEYHSYNPTDNSFVPNSNDNNRADNPTDDEEEDSSTQKEDQDPTWVGDDRKAGQSTSRQKSSKRRRSPSSKRGQADNSGDKNAPPKRTRIKKRLKDPDAPKHPMSAFLHFLTTVRPKYTEMYRGSPIGVISKMISEEWKTLAPEKKEEYVRLSTQEKERYKELMRQHVNKSGGASPPE